MKLFVIHRFKHRDIAKKILNQIAKQSAIKAQFIFLDSFNNIKWQKKAREALMACEAVIIYGSNECAQSVNSKWEIDLAKSLNKTIIEIDNIDNNESKISTELLSLYNYKDEFESCFAPNIDNYFELYKLMIDSSEQLIQRRQKTNSFFITIIGLLITIAGFLFETETINSDSLCLLYGFAIVGLLLCKSWRNLIDNYGKLNKAKFDVILQLEKSLDAQIYSAEWIALGKGKRPQKYKSFTSTEKNVPLYFSLLIIALSIALTIWYVVK